MEDTDFDKRLQWLEQHSTRVLLLRWITAYLEVTGISPETFGWRAAGETGFVARLQEGKGCTIDKLDTVKWFIAHSLTPTQETMFQQLTEENSNDKDQA